LEIAGFLTFEQCLISAQEGLSMQFESLAFVMTNKCNAACKMCCFFCSPQKSALLDIGLMKDYIRQAYEIGSFKTIAFTGGEAILYYEQLRDCIAYAHSFGFGASLVSNGFWAAGYEKGVEMIKGLVEAGLTDISISVDQFHQEYVPLQSVKNAIRIIESLGVRLTLTLADLKGGLSSKAVMRELRPGIYGKKLFAYPIFPVGGAALSIPDEQILKICDRETACCAFNNGITVLFDGTLMMCCSQFSSEIEMTHIGQFGCTSLKDAIASFHQNDFLYVLMANRFKWYVDLAEGLGFKLGQYYSVPCHLCHALFTNTAFVEAAAPFVKAEAGRLRIKKLFG
jgi:hypothetical protein